MRAQTRTTAFWGFLWVWCSHGRIWAPVQGGSAGLSYVDVMGASHTDVNDGSSWRASMTTLDGVLFMETTAVASELSQEVQRQRNDAAAHSAPRKSFTPLGLRAFVALVLCLGILGIVRQRLAAPKAVPPAAMEDASPAEQTPQVEAALATLVRQRLSSVRKLFPVAERLAAAVGTSEAEDLLKTVKENVGITEQEESRSTERLMDSLRSSLQALRRLQECAVEEGKRIAKADDAGHLGHVLEHWEDSKLAQLAERNQMHNVLLPISSSLDGLRGSIWRLTFRSGVIRERLSGEKLFEKETDGDKLESAARLLRCLRATHDARQRTVSTAKVVEGHAMSALKSLLTRNREVFFRRATMDADLAGAYAAMASRRMNRELQSGAEVRLAQQNALRNTEELLKKIEDGLQRLYVEMEKATESEGLAGLIKSAVDGHEEELAVKKSLEECWNSLSFCDGQQNLEESEIVLFRKVASKAQAAAVAQSATLRQALKELEAFSKPVSFAGTSPGQLRWKFRLGENVAEIVLASLKETTQVAEDSVEKIGEMVDSMRSTETLKSAVERLKEIIAAALTVTNAQGASVSHVVSYSLLNVLQESMEHSEARVGLVSSRQPEVPKETQEQLERLQKFYNAAYEAAKAATTLQRIAEASNSMRIAAEEMELLLVDSGV